MKKSILFLLFLGSVLPIYSQALPGSGITDFDVFVFLVIFLIILVFGFLITRIISNLLFKKKMLLKVKQVWLRNLYAILFYSVGLTVTISYFINYSRHRKFEEFITICAVFLLSQLLCHYLAYYITPKKQETIEEMESKDLL